MEKLEFTKALKQEWLEALKSGRYKQGETQLKSQDKHCCLGVLCDIHPRLSISESGESILMDDVQCFGYDPLSTLLNGKLITENLWRSNDRNTPGDYSNVIPIIEALPTID